MTVCGEGEHGGAIDMAVGNEAASLEALVPVQNRNPRIGEYVNPWQ
jgi:hypothetical protein